jgi:hypothetical protein
MISRCPLWVLDLGIILSCLVAPRLASHPALALTAAILTADLAVTGLIQEVRRS